MFSSDLARRTSQRRDVEGRTQAPRLRALRGSRSPASPSYGIRAFLITQDLGDRFDLVLDEHYVAQQRAGGHAGDRIRRVRCRRTMRWAAAIR